MPDYRLKLICAISITILALVGIVINIPLIVALSGMALMLLNIGV
jgi:hypothetical protein